MFKNQSGFDDYRPEIVKNVLVFEQSSNTCWFLHISALKPLNPHWFFNIRTLRFLNAMFKNPSVFAHSHPKIEPQRVDCRPLGPAGGHALATLFGRPPVHQSLTECSKTHQFLTHLGLKSSNPHWFLNISLPTPSTVILGPAYRKSNPSDLKNTKKW